MLDGTHQDRSLVKARAGVLTVDLEDYYHVEGFADVIDRSTWDAYPSRIGQSTHALLDRFDQAGVKATFFALGWVARRHPALIRAIAERGHEIGCHSYWHRLVYRLTPDAFLADTRLAKDVIEQAAGRAVTGYRAPSFSITRASLWALDVLEECGFRYDSSIFPICHDRYGMSAAPRRPFRTGGDLVEYPMATFRWAGRTWPVAGGGYLRQLPWWYTRLGLQRAQAEGLPLVMYVHPWEVDPAQPRLPGRWSSRLRHYRNLDRTMDRLTRVLALARFSSFRDSGVLEGSAPRWQPPGGVIPLPVSAAPSHPLPTALQATAATPRPAWARRRPTS